MYLTLGALGASLIGGFGLYGFVDHNAKEYEEDASHYENYQQAIKNAGLEGYSVRDIITELYNYNYITDAEYKDALDSLDTFETVYKGNADWKEAGAYILQDDSARKRANQLLQTLTKGVSKIEVSDYNQITDYLNSVATGGANAPGNAIAYAPSPNYESTDFEGYQLDIDPVKLWTGQELADLHNIEYNPDIYYDLIKQGTTAEVDRARFESALMNEASMVNDTANVTSYLDNIRNTKAEAISTGATAGAQAAAEVLQNKEAINNYASDQASVANARYNAVDNALLADAQAKLNARDYFNNLASTLGQDILTLYANDTDRFGQEWLSNSELYKADQELRGQRAYNNASMYANAVQANAAIAGYKQQANSLGDEYAWVFNNYLNANNGNIAAAKLDMNKYLQQRYTNYTNRPDLYYAISND